MANVLDLKRRIRSVKNTRQITKAMKMVSAAKLRRAQERAVTARPYAQMMASVIRSLMRRIDVYNPKTGELRHPLLVPREEKNVLLIVVSGDKGFAGAFNSNIIKAANRFITAQNGGQGRNVDIETIGRKARDLFRRRYPAAKITTEPEDSSQAASTESEGMSLESELEERPLVRQRGERSAPIEVTGDHPGMLEKLRFEAVAEIGQDIVAIPVIRPKTDRALKGCFGVGDSSGVLRNGGHSDHRVGIAWIDNERLLEFAQRDIVLTESGIQAA